MHTVKRIILIYFVLSLFSFLAVVLVAVINGGVNSDEAWIHTFIIAAMSLLLYVFARRATAGNEKALLRVRIVVAILLVALIVTALVLSIPLWLRIEHFVAFALLAWAAVLLFRKHVQE